MANRFAGTQESGGGSIDLPTAYSATGSTRHLWTADDAVGPRGATDADKFYENYTTNNSCWDSKAWTAVSGEFGNSETVYYSVFLKANEKDWAILRYQSDGTYYGQYFDLANGSVGSAYQSNAAVDSGIVDYGNGWYRCWLEGVTSTDGQFGVVIETAIADNDFLHVGVIGEGYHGWGAWVDTVNYTDWNGASPIRSGQDSVTAGTSVVISSADGWSSAPPSGSILLGFASFRHSSDNPIGTITLPTDFTELQRFTTESGTTTVPGFISFAKISDGTETSFTLSTGTAPLSTGFIMLAFDPTLLDSTIGNFILDVDSSLWLGTNTDITCGAASNTQPTALCVAVVYNELGTTFWGAGTWSNSFNQVAVDDWDAAGLTIATKLVSSTGSQSTLYSGSGTGTQILSELIIINEPGSFKASFARNSTVIIQ